MEHQIPNTLATRQRVNQKRIENSAKAIIIQEGRILLIRYADTSFGLGTWYSLPGGRQQYGQTLQDTMVRECNEEIGAKIKISRLAFVREYIHQNHELEGKGRDQHKVEFMFICGLESPVTNVHLADDDQAAIEWVPLDDLPMLNIFPTRLKELTTLLLSTGDLSTVYWGDVY